MFSDHATPIDSDNHSVFAVANWRGDSMIDVAMRAYSRCPFYVAFVAASPRFLPPRNDLFAEVPEVEPHSD